MLCQGQGHSLMGQHTAGRAVVPKERFCRNYNLLGSGLVPKEHFLGADLSVVSRDQNSKDGRQVRKSTDLSNRNNNFASL